MADPGEVIGCAEDIASPPRIQAACLTVLPPAKGLDAVEEIRARVDLGERPGAGRAQ